MMQLSPHFTLEELTFSQASLRLGIPNNPNPSQISTLTRLCMMLLEPARVVLCNAAGREVALHVDSGFRSPMVNNSVGGSTNSAHMSGRAADVIPIGMPLIDAFNALRKSSLPFDQLIFECQAWIHIAAPIDGMTPRLQALLASGRPGAWSYQEVVA